MRIIISLVIAAIVVNLEAQKASIPFYINEFNRIILVYPINNKTLHLLFDSAIPFNLIDKDISENINFARPNNNKIQQISTIANIPLNVIIHDGVQPYKQDSIFWGGWMLTDMKETAKILQLGEKIDGIVGYESNYILELDFKRNKLLVWETFPKGCFSVKRTQKIKLVDSDYRGTYQLFLGNIRTSIQSELTVLDTVKLQPNLILDTGFPLSVSMVIYDSLLMKKLIEFRKQKGNSHSTTRLRIPELRVDSIFTGLSVIDKSVVNNDGVNPYRNAIGGLLGVAFMRKYKRVIIDRKNQLAWFEKFE